MSHMSGIIDTLVQASTAILRYLHILQTHEVDNDGDMICFESLPLMFTTLDSYLKSKQSFEEVIGPNHSSLFKSVYCMKWCDVECKFCEAVGIDVSHSSKEKNHKEAVNHSMALVKVLFEDFGLSGSSRIIDHYLSDNDALDLNATLFNKSKELTVSYQFQQYIGLDSSMNDDDILFFDLHESWCLTIITIWLR
jgi:hypothetical protein